jgi:hypothetical protein
MGELYHFPTSQIPTTPNDEAPTELENENPAATDDDSVDWQPYLPGRTWSGVMTLPSSAIVDHDRIERGDVVLVADDGLTRSATVIDIIDAFHIVVNVGLVLHRAGHRQVVVQAHSREMHTYHIAGLRENRTAQEKEGQ